MGKVHRVTGALLPHTNRITVHQVQQVQFALCHLWCRRNPMITIRIHKGTIHDLNHPFQRRARLTVRTYQPSLTTRDSSKPASLLRTSLDLITIPVRQVIKLPLIVLHHIKVKAYIISSTFNSSNNRIFPLFKVNPLTMAAKHIISGLCTSLFPRADLAVCSRCLMTGDRCVWKWTGLFRG